MLEFVRNQILANPKAQQYLGQVTLSDGTVLPDLLELLKQRVGADGYASQTILNTLFTMYTYWMNLSRLAADNVDLPENNENYKLNVYGSPPELAILFNAYMPELQAIQAKMTSELPRNPTPKQVQKATKVFRVDNFKISDRSKIFGVARDKNAEQANAVNLKDEEGMKAYRKLVEQQCLVIVNSDPALRLDDPKLKDKVTIDYQTLLDGTALKGRPAIELRAELDNLRQALKQRNEFVKAENEAQRKLIGRPKKKKGRSPRA